MSRIRAGTIILLGGIPIVRIPIVDTVVEAIPAAVLGIILAVVLGIIWEAILGTMGGAVGMEGKAMEGLIVVHLRVEIPN